MLYQLLEIHPSIHSLPSYYRVRGRVHSGQVTQFPFFASQCGREHINVGGLLSTHYSSNKKKLWSYIFITYSWVHNYANK